MRIHLLISVLFLSACGIPLEYPTLPGALNDSPYPDNAIDTSRPWSTLLKYTLSNRANSVAQAAVIQNSAFLIIGGKANDGTSDIATIVQYDIVEGSAKQTLQYQSVPGLNAEITDLSSGTGSLVYAVGNAIQGSHHHAIFMKSSNQGGSWSFLASYQLSGGADTQSKAIAVDSSGNLFWLLSASDSTSLHWLLRTSTDSGNSWTTLDDYQQSSGEDSEPFDVVTISGGKLVAVGKATSSGSESWIVRTSTNSGGSWSTTTYQLSPSFSAEAHTALVTENGKLIVAGQANDGTDEHWIVRTSNDFNVTWSTVIDYQRNEGYDSSAFGIEATSVGDILSSGYSTSLDGSRHWMILNLRASDNTLHVLDDYQNGNGQNANSIRILRLDDTEFYSVGSALNADNLSNWILRHY